MFPLKRACIALAGIALAACGNDRSVNPIAEIADGSVAAITSGGTLVAQYSLLVGQSVKINPKTTTRTNRLKWSSSNSTVASVSWTGTVTARASGSATVQVSGTGVLENYAITVTAAAAPKVTSFSLQPKTGVSLTSGQSQQFAASATWSDGMQYPITVSYTATGGTISGTGLFTAGNLAGTFMVVATCACTSPAIADTAFVNITAPQLTKLTISPKTVSLAAGASQQFAVTANWSTGATTVPPVTWSASGGTVSSTGAYVAPSAAGTYRVIVAHTNGTVRDTAVVTVANTGGGSSTPSAAVQVLFSDGFESGGFKTAQNGISWTSAPWMDVTSVFGLGSSRAARFRQGDSKEWAELRFGGLPNLSEVFLQYWLYQPNGQETTPVGVDVAIPGSRNDKFFRLWGGDYGGANDIKYGASTWGGNIGVEYKRANGDGTLWGMGEGGDPISPDVLTYAPFVGRSAFKGRWTKVQIRCKTATPGVNNGIIQIWLDGTLVVSRTQLASYAGTGGSNVFQSGYILGWANNGFAAGQFMYLDNFTISTGGFP